MLSIYSRSWIQNFHVLPILYFRRPLKFNPVFCNNVDDECAENLPFLSG
jgi:hypothetical protein